MIGGNPASNLPASQKAKSRKGVLDGQAASRQLSYSARTAAKQSAMEDEGPQIRVKFVTQNAAVRVTETPFAVPLRLARPGLSQVVNHLLNTGSKPRPFDFLIDGLFLRSSLEKYVQTHGVSEEALLTLEYVEALPEPDEQQSTSHPDWVGAVSAATDSSGHEYLATGCYDGLLRVHDASGECLASVKAHQGAVKAVSIAVNESGEVVVASSGKDQLGQLWRFDATSKQLTALAALTGHLNSVDAIALDASAKRVITGSWDNTVRVWDVPSSTSEDTDAAPKKKQKKSSAGAAEVTFRQLEASAVLVGHTSHVTGVAFHPTREDQAVSASSDRTVRVWDLTTHSASQTMAGNRAATGVSVNAAGLVLTAHPDHCVRLWDPKAAEAGEAVVQRTFQSHKQWVSSVAWHPTQPHLFLSAGYDGHVKVWDARSTIPLHTLAAHSGKALDVAWRQPATDSDNETIAFASGGEDKQLKLFSI